MDKTYIWSECWVANIISEKYFIKHLGFLGAFSLGTVFTWPSVVLPDIAFSTQVIKAIFHNWSIKVRIRIKDIGIKLLIVWDNNFVNFESLLDNLNGFDFINLRLLFYRIFLSQDEAQIGALIFIGAMFSPFLYGKLQFVQKIIKCTL